MKEIKNKLKANKDVFFKLAQRIIISRQIRPLLK